MSDFSVIVVEGGESVITTKEEIAVEVCPQSEPSIEVNPLVSEVFVTEETFTVIITQSPGFSVDVVEAIGEGCCDPSTVDIPALSISKEFTESAVILDLVSASSPTQVELADVSSLTEATVMGVSLEIKAIGEIGKIHIFGVLEHVSFTYPVNAQLFLGAGGFITDTPTIISGEFVTQIGYSLGTGAIFVNISEPTEIL